MGACFRLIASNLRPNPNVLRYDDPYEPTSFALERIAADDPFRLLWPNTKKPSPDKPFLPSLVAPSSFNLLICVMRKRVRRQSPSPKSLIEETSLKNLDATGYTDIVNAVSFPANALHS
ncbi:hypothetical protein Rt10032_c11g4441 [Rhodotorula toruloides]|uniref:Uncharacterized protein n=1 Tax=Rhodotorula toruloides TaxID=5286 RepID=A0A511KLR3_RHOTO|nr:hypothetical protein Rt10032_c11g4441 [Rhodotorula toruloides]